MPNAFGYFLLTEWIGNLMKTCKEGHGGKQLEQLMSAHTGTDQEKHGGEGQSPSPPRSPLGHVVVKRALREASFGIRDMPLIDRRIAVDVACG
jgi:hypothetical protein